MKVRYDICSRNFRRKLSKVRAIPKTFTEKGLYACYRFEKSSCYGYNSCYYRVFCPFERLSRNLNILSTETDEKAEQKTLT